MGKLLVPAPKWRLGNKRSGGAAAIIEHAFFKDFPWREMEARIVPAPHEQPDIIGEHGVQKELVPERQLDKSRPLPFKIEQALGDVILWCGGEEIPMPLREQERTPRAMSAGGARGKHVPDTSASLPPAGHPSTSEGTSGSDEEDEAPLAGSIKTRSDDVKYVCAPTTESTSPATDECGRPYA